MASTADRTSSIFGSVACPCMLDTDLIWPPQSPVPNMRGNAIPTPSEKSRIHPALSHVRRDLAELDNALRHLQSARERLLLKRASFQTFLDAHNGLLSSIRLMPPEILAEIFSYLKRLYRDPRNPMIPISTGIPGLNTTPARSVVVVPTHVCQQWRRVALSTPSLWSDISVHIKQTRNITGLKMDCVKAWLERSRGCPLSVDIRCQPRLDRPQIPDSDCQTPWNALLDAILPHSFRWQHAIIFWDTEIRTDLSTIRNNLPWLESLKLRSGGTEHDFTNTFEIAPLLRHVQVIHAPRGHFQSIHQLPWAQLSDFTYLAPCSVQQGLAFLQMMPNIISFVSNMQGGQPEIFNPLGSPLRLSKLENLDVWADLTHHTNDFFDSLLAPSLKALTFWQPVRPPWMIPAEWSTSLISLIRRSSCNLTRLELTIWDEDDQASARDLIILCSKLQHIALAHWVTDRRDALWGYSSTIECLTVSPVGGTAPPTVPELHTLEVTYAKGFQTREFLDMVESRWRVDSEICQLEPVVSRLRAVALRGVPGLDIFDAVGKERLRILVAGGLNVRLHPYNEALIYHRSYCSVPFT